MKTIGILGASGSIGKSALDVLAAHPKRFQLDFISVHTNITSLDHILRQHDVQHVLVTEKNAYIEAKKKYPALSIYSEEEMSDFLREHPVDIVVNALVGTAGLLPSMILSEEGRDIALANKESLVCAGELMMEAGRKSGSRLFPVDSEHSAIWQCLEASPKEKPEKIFLTASGGAFRDMKREEIEKADAGRALKHPNWSMGKKITIDSATLMNKGLEVMEARWLFDLEPEQIEVLIHRQSIVHSMVQFQDGSIIAQLGTPDMRLPISYALSYPERLENTWPRVDLLSVGSLDFASVDEERFPGLALCIEALQVGGDRPMVLNVANEWMVEKYLEGKAGFYDITDWIRRAMSDIKRINKPSLHQLLERKEVVREYLEEHFD